MVRDENRYIYKVTKKKSSPPPLCSCVECEEKLPLIKDLEYSYKKHGKECIVIDYKTVDSFFIDMLFEIFPGYHYRAFKDTYHCLKCGAQWESGAYKSLIEKVTANII